MGQLIKLSENCIEQLRVGGFGAVIRFLSRYADMLIVPWIFEIQVLYTYALARLISLALPISLAFLEFKVGPHLKVLVRLKRKLPFQAAAARVNLGYMMICGAVALLTLSLGPKVATFAELGGEDFGQILIWLVVGQSAPVLFGATGLLMQVNDRGAFYEMLLSLTAALFVICVVVLGGNDPAAIAQTLAVAQLTHAGICALLLTQCGVWPGLTAIFHNEIKLF